MKLKLNKDKVVPDMAHLNPILKKALDHMDLLDPVEKMQLFAVFLEIAFKDGEEEVFDGWQKYTNTYFQAYYEINSKTFLKWMEIFCPEILVNHRIEKRLLYTKAEWEIVMKKIGWCDGYSFRPFSKNDIAMFLARHDEVNNMSPKAIYAKYEPEINKYIKPEESPLYILPPVIAHRILKAILSDEFNPSFSKPNVPRTNEFKANWMIQLVERILTQSDGERYAFYHKAKKFFDNLFNEMKEEIDRTRINEN